MPSEPTQAVPIDRDVLARLSSQVPERGADSVRDLLRALHRTPGLRELVTLESVALVPVPTRSSTGWTLTGLIAAPREDEPAAYHAAWGLVRWSWPPGRPIAMIDLREDPAHRGPRERAAARGRREWTPPPGAELARHELLERLDRVLEGDGDGLPDLGDLYRRALAPAALALYRDLLAAEAPWLPSAAIELEASSAPALPPRPDPHAIVVREAPPDLAGEVSGWIEEAGALVRTSGVQPVAEQLAAINRRRLLPGFRLAVIGGANRGKSSLINALLGLGVLPTGATSRTMPPVAVVVGDPHLELRWRDGRSERHPLRIGDWTPVEDAASTGELAGVRCHLDHAWLRELDAELVETPAIDEASARELVQRTLDMSDAALLVVSAAIPMSLTEHDFLEREVLGRHIVRIGLVTTCWDAVAAADRDDVRAMVSEIARASAADIVVAELGHGTGPLRAAVETLAGRSDRAVWRARQHARQLVDCLDALDEACASAIEAATLSDEEREHELARRRDEIQRHGFVWEQIRLELDQRRLALTAALRQQLGATRKSLVEGLVHELECAPDAKRWWERDLPRRMARELSAASKQLEEDAHRRARGRCRVAGRPVRGGRMGATNASGGRRAASAGRSARVRRTAVARCRALEAVHARRQRDRDDRGDPALPTCRNRARHH